MRLNECEQVKETLGKHLGINLTVVDGAELFLSRLKGVTEPEKKRKVIGKTCTFASSNPTPLTSHLRSLTVKQSSISSKKKRSGLRRKLSIRQTQVQSSGFCKAQYVFFLLYLDHLLTLKHVALP